MLMAIPAALALMGRLPFVSAGLLMLTWVEPGGAAPLLALMALVARRRHRHQEEPSLVAFHRSLAAELRAGLSLRMALVVACRAVPGAEMVAIARLAAAGRPLEEVAGALRAADRRLRATAGAVRVAAATGGSTVRIFDALTAEAADEEALGREQRSLTVQARLSVAIVGGFPLLTLAWQVISGELARVVAMGPAGMVMVVLGSTLLLAGLGSVILLMRRPQP